MKNINENVQFTMERQLNNAVPFISEHNGIIKNIADEAKNLIVEFIAQHSFGLGIEFNRFDFECDVDKMQINNKMILEALENNKHLEYKLDNDNIVNINFKNVKFN